MILRKSSVFLIVGAVVGCSGPAPSPPVATPKPPPAVASQPAVELQILDFDGIQRLLARHRGRVVVMDAWSTSCPPCLREFPRLVELQERYGRADVACVSLSFDYEGLGSPQESVEPVLDFLRAQKATFDNILSSEASDVLYRKFALASVPAVFVYDRAGNLRQRFDNEQSQTAADAFSYEQVSQLVDKMLREQPMAER